MSSWLCIRLASENKGTGVRRCLSARSSRLQCLIDSTALLQPCDVTAFGVLRNITQQLYCLGLVAGFARVILRDDGLNLDRYRFNYAYCPNENLETVHKITIGLQVP